MKFFALALLLIACGPDPVNTPDPTVQATPVPQPTPSPTCDPQAIQVQAAAEAKATIDAAEEAVNVILQACIDRYYPSVSDIAQCIQTDVRPAQLEMTETFDAENLRSSARGRMADAVCSCDPDRLSDVTITLRTEAAAAREADLSGGYASRAEYRYFVMMTAAKLAYADSLALQAEVCR